MKIIFLNGPLASGKSTVGRELAARLRAQGFNSVFMDLDKEVQYLNPTWRWVTDESRQGDWLQARKNVARMAEAAALSGAIVVVAGPFFTDAEINGVLRFLAQPIEIYLYNLDVPLAVRQEREASRGRNAAEDLARQQAKIDEYYREYRHHGEAIANNRPLDETVEQLCAKIEIGLGKLQRSQFAQ